MEEREKSSGFSKFCDTLCHLAIIEIFVSELFKNQTAIISGGLGDIGRAIALAFVEQGAAVALGDVRPAKEAKKFLRELMQKNARIHYQQVDVADARQVQRWVAKVEKELGVPSLIVPSAAIVTVGHSSAITPKQWTRELRVNLDGAFFLAQAAANRLLHHAKPGRIVFIGSWAGQKPHCKMPAYSVSKAGLRMLCQCMALELALHKILVNELAPGYVDAGLSKTVWAKNAGLYQRSRKKVPLQKLIHPDEVAAQVIHLCHPKNQHMTGSTLLMDGGLSLLC